MKNILQLTKKFDTITYSKFHFHLDDGIAEIKKLGCDLLKITVDEIKNASDALSAASHKLAEAMYAKASQQKEAESPEGPTAEEKGKAPDEDVVDADFEEVK